MTRSHPLCMVTSSQGDRVTTGDSCCDVSRTLYLRPYIGVDRAPPQCYNRSYTVSGKGHLSATEGEKSSRHECASICRRRESRKGGKMMRKSAVLSALALVAIVLALGKEAALAQNSITTPDGPGIVGNGPTLVLDASGNPVVAYGDVTGEDLKILHCNDPNCAGGDDSITVPDFVGAVGEGPDIRL